MSHREPTQNDTRQPRARLRRAVPAVAGAAGLAVIIGLAGCGGGQSQGPSSQTLLKARSKTIAAKAARVSVNASLTSLPGSQTRALHLTENGVVNFRQNAAEGTVRIRGSAPVQLRVVNGKVYERPAGHTTWTVMSVAAARSMAGAALSSLAPISPGDPAGALVYLGLPSSKLTTIGTQRIGGAATTHYHGILDNNGSVLVPVDLWVDKQGRVRKIAMTLRQPAGAISTAPASPGTPSPAATGKTSPNAMLHLVVNFSDFGTKATVSPPPAAQTASAMKGGH